MKHGGDIYRNPVKLDFSVNINPLGIPERVREALTQAVSECMHYPDMEAEALLQAIGRMTGYPQSISCAATVRRNCLWRSCMHSNRRKY